MRNILGNVVTLTLFGESHGKQIGATIDGLPSGILINHNFIKECLNKRRPRGNGETTRIEQDDYEIISGTFNDYTTGAPLTILIHNQNTNSKNYEKNKDLARPSHVDYVANIKYNGFQDYRGAGHFSGRITTPIVIAGAIALDILKKQNIEIATHIKQIGNIIDSDFENFEDEIIKVNQMDFPVIQNLQSQMEEEILKAAKQNDSIGGIIQCVIYNLPAGIGEPWFSSLEGEISKAIFAIGGIKGIEFGLGFNFKNYYGSQVNDQFTISNQHVITKSNNNGGINGGISNGMPILFNVAVKPTPSIYKSQQTINMKSLTNQEILIQGRHDPCIVRRMNIVIRCLCAFVILDMMYLSKK